MRPLYDFIFARVWIHESAETKNEVEEALTTSVQFLPKIEAVTVFADVDEGIAGLSFEGCTRRAAVRRITPESESSAFRSAAGGAASENAFNSCQVDIRPAHFYRDWSNHELI